MMVFQYMYVKVVNIDSRAKTKNRLSTFILVFADDPHSLLVVLSGYPPSLSLSQRSCFLLACDSEMAPICHGFLLPYLAANRTYNVVRGINSAQIFHLLAPARSKFTLGRR